MKIKDLLIIGILIGLLAPTIGIFGFYAFNFSMHNLAEFVELSIKEKLLSPLLSLCCVINLGVFYLFIHFEKFKIAKGIILATFLYGFAIVVLKFFM
jgi:hypothetical protein